MKINAHQQEPIDTTSSEEILMKINAYQQEPIGTTISEESTLKNILDSFDFLEKNKEWLLLSKDPKNILNGERFIAHCEDFDKIIVDLSKFCLSKLIYQLNKTNKKTGFQSTLFDLYENNALEDVSSDLKNIIEERLVNKLISVSTLKSNSSTDINNTKNILKYAFIISMFYSYYLHTDKYKIINEGLYKAYINCLTINNESKDKYEITNKHVFKYLYELYIECRYLSGKSKEYYIEASINLNNSIWLIAKAYRSFKMSDEICCNLSALCCIQKDIIPPKQTTCSMGTCPQICDLPEIVMYNIQSKELFTVNFDNIKKEGLYYYIDTNNLVPTTNNLMSKDGLLKLPICLIDTKKLSLQELYQRSNFFVLYNKRHPTNKYDAWFKIDNERKTFFCERITNEKPFCNKYPVVDCIISSSQRQDDQKEMIISGNFVYQYVDQTSKVKCKRIRLGPECFRRKHCSFLHKKYFENAPTNRYLDHHHICNQCVKLSGHIVNKSSGKKIKVPDHDYFFEKFKGIPPVQRGMVFFYIPSNGYKMDENINLKAYLIMILTGTILDACNGSTHNYRKIEINLSVSELGDAYVLQEEERVRLIGQIKTICGQSGVS